MDHELYAVLALIFTVIFSGFDLVKSFPMRQAAKAVTEQLGKLVEASVKSSSGYGFMGLFSSGGGADKNDPLNLYETNLVKGLMKRGASTYDVTWGQILPMAGAMVANQGEVVRFLPLILIRIHNKCTHLKFDNG